MFMSGYQMKMGKEQDSSGYGEMLQIQDHTLGAAGGGKLGEDCGHEGGGLRWPHLLE